MPRTRSVRGNGVARPPVGSLEWERNGGPPLSLPQRLSLLSGTAVVLLGDAGPRLRWTLGHRCGHTPRPPRKIDLAPWAPSPTEAVRAAEAYLREVASQEIIDHSYRTYYFTAIRYELDGSPVPLDREALCVAALLHDTGLFDAERRGCFTVAGARRARQIGADAGWDTARLDAAALAITTNLNPFVPVHRYGPVAHYLQAGGLVDVLAQQWRVHPGNLAEIVDRYPRDGFAEDTARLVRREARRNPGCRFACFGPIFPTAVRWSNFATP